MLNRILISMLGSFRPFLVSILFCSFPFITIAQDSTAVEYHPSVWIEGGTGKVGMQLGYDMSLLFSINEKNFISVNHDAAIEISNETQQPFKDATSYSLRFGILKRAKFGIAQYSIGISYSTGKITKWDQFYSKIEEGYSTIGITPKIGFLLSPNVLGVGMTLFMHINTKFTYAGLTISLALGQINGRVKK